MSHEQAIRGPLQLAAESFFLDRQARRCSPDTLIWYRKYVGALVTWLNAHAITRPEDITPSHLRAFLVELHGKGLSPHSVHHHASAARAFLNFLVAEGLIVQSPMHNVPMPKLPSRILPSFTPKEAQELLKACKSNRDRAIILFLLDTGCRAGEFVGLDVGDVDVRTGTVRIQGGKGGRDRIVFIGAKARRALIHYLMERGNPAPEAPLWISQKTGRRLTHWGLRLMLRRIGKRANVAHCSPHTFRRTFAIWSLRSGMNIYVLQRLMGHSDLTVLRRYLEIVERDLADAHRRFGAVDNML